MPFAKRAEQSSRLMQNNPRIACQYLDWDSQFFGCRIGRLYATELGEDDMPAVHAWRRENRVDCLYCLAADGRTMQSLEGHAFQMVDIRLSLRCARSSGPGDAPAKPQGVIIRPADVDDLPALRGLAESSHSASRFFQ